MLEKVVVAIDGSAASEAILSWCIRAFGGGDAEIMVVFCRTVRHSLGDANNEQLRAGHQPVVDDACARLQQAGLRCRGVILDGDARSAILHFAAAEDADLIVVGSRGHSPLADLMLGSVATYLTHHSPLPVTVVRP